MVACFFGKTGHVATVPLEQRRTVNSEWYTTICLPEVFGEIRKTNKRRWIIVYHDNARSYTSAQTSAFLTGQNVELIGHPANDFFLFLHIKKKMHGQRFSSPEDAVEAFKNHVLEVSQAEWKKCLDNWFERMQKCINQAGEYFENNKTIFDDKYSHFHYWTRNIYGSLRINIKLLFFSYCTKIIFRATTNQMADHFRNDLTLTDYTCFKTNVYLQVIYTVQNTYHTFGQKPAL